MKSQVSSSEKNGVLRLKKGYNFSDKDQIIDVLRTAVDDSGASWDDIAAEAGICKGTLYRWFQGNVIKPQIPTVAAVGRALGLQLTFVAVSPTSIRATAKHRH